MRNSILQIIRFLIVGICVVAFNLFLLRLFTEVFHVWYLFSSIVSYALAVILNFTLQKFWVFPVSSLESVKKQLLSYGIVSIGYLALNTFFMYISVDYLNIRYLWAQAGITLILSTANYFINRTFIFKNQNSQ